MKYDALKKFIKRDILPASIVVVSEDYPAECISYRILLNPRQPQFHVKGCDLQASRPGSSSSDKSLQLKAAGKAVTRKPETPRSPSVASSVDSEGHRVVSPLDKVAVSSLESTEEFDAVIQKARELKNLPLETEDEPSSRPTSSEGPDTDDDEPEKGGLTLLRKQKSKYQRFQDKFQCMQKHTGDKAETPNAATVAILEQMADYYGQIGDEWRLRAYGKAISTLRNHPTKVWTKAEASSLPQIGERLATKIEEIAFTNRLRRFENAKAEPGDQILQMFMGV